MIQASDHDGLRQKSMANRICNAMMWHGFREVAMAILQIIAGIALGLGGIGAVFWMTFRRPPTLRPHDSATSITSNSDADYLLRNARDDGQGGLS